MTNNILLHLYTPESRPGQTMLILVPQMHAEKKS